MLQLGIEKCAMSAGAPLSHDRIVLENWIRPDSLTRMTRHDPSRHC